MLYRFIVHTTILRFPSVRVTFKGFFSAKQTQTPNNKYYQIILAKDKVLALSLAQVTIAGQHAHHSHLEELSLELLSGSEICAYERILFVRFSIIGQTVNHL